MSFLEPAGGYDRVWAELAAAAGSRRHGFHTFTLATVDARGLPQARTMVLRAADPQSRTIRFHCDARSPKTAEMRDSPAACAVFYGAGEKLQVRVYGTVTVHAADSVTEQAWREMQPMSREVYRAPSAPGSPRADDTENHELLPPEAARNNLAVCDLRFRILEWLSLSSGGHERVRHRWESDGVISSERLCP